MAAAAPAFFSKIAMVDGPGAVASKTTSEAGSTGAGVCVVELP